MTTVDMLELVADVLVIRPDDSPETAYAIRRALVDLAERLVEVADTVQVGSERWARLHAVAMGLARVAEAGDAT